jgi:hypothetical protein
MRPRGAHQAGSADAAPAEPREQGRPGDPRGPRPGAGRLRRRERCGSSLTPLPEAVVDDAEPLVGDAHQVRLGPDHADLRAPAAIGLLPTVPDHLASVELTPEDLPEGRRSPAWASVALSGGRRRRPLGRQRLRNRPEARSARVEFEDVPDRGRSPLEDLPLDVAVDADVDVPVHDPAGDVARLRLPGQRVVGPSTRLLPLGFGRESRQRRHDLAERRIHGGPAIVEVVPDGHAGVGDPLSVYAISICSRPSRDGSAMMTTSTIGRGRSAASRAVNHDRRSNSAPEIPSST